MVCLLCAPEVITGWLPCPGGHRQSRLAHKTMRDVNRARCIAVSFVTGHRNLSVLLP